MIKENKYSSSIINMQLINLHSDEQTKNIYTKKKLIEIIKNYLTTENKIIDLNISKFKLIKEKEKIYIKGNIGKEIYKKKNIKHLNKDKIIRIIRKILIDLGYSE